MNLFNSAQKMKWFLFGITLIALLLTGCAPALHLSAKNGDLAKVNSLLYSGTDVNEMASDNSTALHCAAYQGHLEMVKLLLAKGAEVDSKAEHFLTPLFAATVEGHLEIVKVLIAHGADVNAKESSAGGTPLILAIAGGHLDVAKELITHGADVSAQLDVGATVLHAAAEYGDAGLLEAILAKGAEVDPRDDNSQTPLFYAAAKGHLEAVKVLLAQGAEVNAKESTIGSFPLNEAIVKGHLEVAHELISHGADLSAHNNHGYTPLHAAADKGYTGLVEAILAKDAEVDPMDKFSQTPLFYAAWRGHIDAVKALLIYGADANIKNNKGFTPPMIAKQNNHSLIIIVLQEGFVKSSKLHLAIRQNDINQIKLLLKEGADLNAKNTDGMTPLHLAAYKNKREIGWVLLDAGAKAEPLEYSPEVTARTYNMVADYYFSKKNAATALEHFEIASEYSEKASLLNAVNSEQFKAANVTIGAVAGGIAGGLLGALTGDKDIMMAGFAAGALIGGGVGHHAEKKRLHFATEEARIEAILSHIDRENQRLVQYIALTRKYVAEIKVQIKLLNQRHASGQKSLEDMQVELAGIRKNREQLVNSIAAFKTQKEKYQLLAESQREKNGDDSVAVLDSRLKMLETEIAKLEGDLDSLDEVLKLSKVG